MSTSEIFNALVVDDRLTTAGQPTEEQLRAAAAEGFDTVISLVPAGQRNAPEDEEALVESLGMVYHYLPVVWNEPTAGDFDGFEQVMRALPADGKTLLHCAANFRVTAFYGLYGISSLGWSVEESEAFRARIWAGSDYPVWEAFVREMHGRLRPEPT